MEKLYWISTPRATYGVLVVEGRIIKAAPIARKFLGKTVGHIEDYYKGMRIKYEIKEIK
jgi:hypothetical protein